MEFLLNRSIFSSAPGPAKLGAFLGVFTPSMLTILGVMNDEAKQVQVVVDKAIWEADALQCGYCTPGQIMSVEGLLGENPDPSLDEIQKGVSGNLCRCGAYPKIIESIESMKGGR